MTSEMVSDSGRTKVLFIIYVISGVIGLIMTIAIVGAMLLNALGLVGNFKLDPWPLPITVVISIVAKYTARWSSRRDSLRLF
ncbi:MAG: hypothetical protein H7315_17800 [Herminiimonas sp.]|nr:hypothetical protein [Herminiimonas sp.]